MNTLSKEILERLYSECTNRNDSPFGIWINGLFSVVAPPTPYLPRTLTFPEQKEAFLYLLERLLREGRVVLTPPEVIEDGEPYYWLIADGYSDNRPLRPATRVDDGGLCRFKVWDVPIEQQIAYIRDAFPKDITGPHDANLNDFWYDGRCPAIGWIDPETGVLWAS